MSTSNGSRGHLSFCSLSLLLLAQCLEQGRQPGNICGLNECTFSLAELHQAALGAVLSAIADVGCEPEVWDARG